MVFWQNGIVVVRCLIQSDINSKYSTKREDGESQVAEEES